MAYHSGKVIYNIIQTYESGISTYVWILSFLAVFQNKRDLKHEIAVIFYQICRINM